MAGNKETWLVFYRTKNGRLTNMEVNGNMTREDAIDVVVTAKKLAAAKTDGFPYLEIGSRGPIVKRMHYGKK